MPAAYIEHRPYAFEKGKEPAHYVIVVNEKEIGPFTTQKEAKEAACAKGFHPIHVARVRDLQDRKKPDHWRKDPC